MKKFLKIVIFAFFLSFFSFTLLLTISGSLRQNFFKFVDGVIAEMNIYSKDFSLSFDELFSSNDESETQEEEKDANNEPQNRPARQTQRKSTNTDNKQAEVSRDAAITEENTETLRSLEIVSSSDNQTSTANDSGGFIFVQSTPDRGLVTIDGQEVGHAPITVKVREPGNYRVGVQVKYHEPYELIVRVDKAEVSRVNAYLKMGKGLLTVVSDPQEATVTLDGKVEGKTPLTIKAIIAGEHEIYLQKGEKEYYGTIEILPDDSKVVNAILKKIRTSLMIKSEPENANIYLNGVGFGKTPNKINNVKIGKYQLVLEKNDSLAFVDSVVIDIEQENVFKGKLIEKKYYSDVFSASLQVNSGMEGVFVRLNSMTYGEAPLAIKSLRSGEHKVLLVKGTRNGSYYYETKIFLQPNENRTMNIPKEQYKFKKVF